MWRPRYLRPARGAQRVSWLGTLWQHSSSQPGRPGHDFDLCVAWTPARHALPDSLLQELIVAAAAALREVYQLVPGVSLGEVTARAVEGAERKLHALFEALLDKCDNVSYLQRQTAELLEPEKLFIWRRHLDIILWSRAWNSLRKQQKEAGQSADPEETSSTMDAEAENILPAGGVLAGAFMDYFQEGLHVRPRQDRLRDLEDQISQEVQTLLKQGFDWTQILHLPNLVDFPAAAAIEFRELMTGFRLSYSPEDVRAEATVEEPAAYDPMSEGTVATDAEIGRRGYAGPPTLPDGAPQPVPPDGLCLSYACVGAHNTEFLSALQRDRSGFVVNPRQDRRFRAAAERFCDAVAGRARAAGRSDVERELRRRDWPGEAALHFFAQELQGSLLITSIYSDMPILFGEGPLAVHVWHGLTEPDAAGHSSGHFELIQSWLPQSRGKDVNRSKPRKRRHESDGSPSSSDEHTADRSARGAKRAPAEPGKRTASSKTAEVPSSSRAGQTQEALQPSRPSALRTSELDRLFEDYQPSINLDVPEVRLRPSAFGTSMGRVEHAAWNSWMDARLKEDALAQDDAPREETVPRRPSDQEQRDGMIQSLWKEFKNAERRSRKVETTVARPSEDDRILVLQQPYLTLILAGSKDLEIRGMRLRPRRIWLGNQGLIFGEAFISEAWEIRSDAEWRQLWSRHHWHCDERPYKRTFAMKLSQVKRCSQPWRYTHPRGAIPIVIYRPVPDERVSDDTQNAGRTTEPARPASPEERDAAPRHHRRPAPAEPIKEKRAKCRQASQTKRSRKFNRKRSRATSAAGMQCTEEETAFKARGDEVEVQRRKQKNKLCLGREGEACRFRRDGSGKAAYASTFSDTQHCIFCHPEAMRRAHSGAAYAVQRILNSLQQKDKDLHDAAVDRMKQFLAVGKHTWDAALQRRESQQDTTPEEVRRGEAARAMDAARAAKKFPEIFGPEATSSWQSPLAQAFEKWAHEESWRLCPGCDRLMPQKFLAGAAGTDPICRTMQSTRCSRCSSNGKIGYAMPTPEDVPAPLQRLPYSVLEALRPFRISCGPGEKAPHGYWVHTAPIRFSWKEQSLQERIADVSHEEDRRRAEEAASWLMDNEQSSFKKFDALQRVFLAALDDDRDVPSRMPLAFMESVGIECAAWPHLYWATTMCETYARSQDRRRLRSAGKPDEAEEEDDDDDDPSARVERRHSAKASFFAKLLSRVIGYGTEYELVQFIYDLWMYSGIGGAQNAAKTNLRAALAGKSFSPEYWRTKHAALQDLQAQLGTPTMFLTIAPYEWTAPYHRWIVDEMTKTARSRTNLPAAESLHLAHILTEAVRGLLIGGYSDSCQDACLLSGSKKAIFFARLEFQDGKRQTLEQQMRTQFYHGRGTVHVHVLVWLQDAENKARLPEIVAAILPPGKTPLGSLVRGSQLDRQDSSWPLREEPSEWDVQANTLRLRHPQDAFAAHCRAYMPDILSSLKCHMDVQGGDGRGHVLRYTAGYIPKFSAAWPTQIEDADTHNIAYRILSEYHPLEMEMMLQLGSHMFPQCFHTGSIRRIVLPVPWKSQELPAEIKRYMQCDWRAPSMPLLHFLRLSDRQGNIHSFVKRQYAEREQETTLEDFANKCRPAGEVMVAAIRYSRANPDFYMQWLMMHVPFRDIDDLWIPRVEAVPVELRGLTLCLLHRPRFWRSMAAIRHEMELEAYRDVFIETRLEAIRAETELVDSYLHGKRELKEASKDAAVEEPTDSPVLSSQQCTILNRIVARVKEAINARTCEEDLDVDAWKNHMEDAKKKRPLACLGAAGTGKSVVAKAAIRQAMQDGAVVGVACPTGLQSCVYRCGFPDACVDTVHSFFGLHAQEELTLALLSDYDLIVVEEVGQISCTHFERIWRLWEAVDRRPVLLFVGDFMQLPAIDNTSARDSPWWKEVLATELTILLRSECPQLSEKLGLLRRKCPGEDQLRWILRGHRASAEGATEPHSDEVAAVLAKHPNATLVTYTRRAAAEMNNMAVTAFFHGIDAAGRVPADPDSNLDNFNGQEYVSYAPSYIDIYIGMRLSLTRNLDKRNDHVNGMSCVVEAVNNHSLEVRTKSGRRLVISKVTEDKRVQDNSVHRSVFFPVRLGYAITLHKVQGSTLEYMALWLDKPNVCTAGYVALSRVRHDRNWCFFGQLTAQHFMPWRYRSQEARM